MQIICVLNAHGEPELLLDTIDSIRTYLTKDIIVVIDGNNPTCLNGHVIPAGIVQGFRHGAPKSPYRNTTLGLRAAYKNYPNADWYCYIEYDCLVASPQIKTDLLGLPKEVWCIGNDYRLCSHITLDFANIIVKSKLPSPEYLLGCCVFYKKPMMDALAKDDFFDRLLWYTNDFSKGYFPFYNGYDIAEHLFPTLAVHYGGKVAGYARYDQVTNKWEGPANIYPMRWKPDIGLDDPYKEASILHPLKGMNNPVRTYHREKRYAR